MKKKKVLCINPPAPEKFGRLTRDGRCQSEESTWSVPFPATTIVAIAGHVRQAGHQVELVDCIGEDIGWEELKLRIKKFKPDVVIINTATPSIYSDLKTAMLAKKINPKAKVAVFGTLPTDLPSEIKKIEPAVDYCLRGDPETPALMVTEGKRPPREIWREKDLNKLGMPAYDLLPKYYFPLNQKRWIWLIDGKGCPYRCIYCVEPKLSGRTARYKNPSVVVKEMDFVVNKLKIPTIMFWDELFTLNKKRCEEICRLIIKRGLNKRCLWMATTRVDKVDFELLSLMKKAGCWMVAFGLESGNQKVLDGVKKDITLSQARKAVAAAKKAGMKTLGHFIAGLPGSSPKTEAETIKFAKELDLDFAQFYTCTAFAGSELYEIALKKNWLSVPDWRGVEQGTANVGYPNFPASEIQKWRRKAYFSFYFRPRFFYNLIRCLSPQAILYLIPRGFKFINWMKK